jgi:hypothetical protein
MLVQVAMQEAASTPASRRQGSPSVAPGGLRRSTSAGELRRNPLRRSASLDGSDFGGRASSVGNVVAITSGPPARGGVSPGLAGPDGRPRSADAAGGAQGLGAWGGFSLGGSTGTRSHPLRQRQQQALQQRAAAQLQHQFARRAAAATLQAHWRGWQHRRLARYLRARRKRAMRLDWLWHLEYVTNLMHWHEAAHTVQATWRGHHSRRTLASPSGVVKPTTKPEAINTGEGASPAVAAEAKEAPAGIHDAAASQQSTAASLVSPVTTAETDSAAEANAVSNGDPVQSSPAAPSGPAQAPTQSVPSVAPPREAGIAPNGARLTVRWREEIAEVRPYAVSQPGHPRW